MTYVLATTAIESCAVRAGRCWTSTMLRSARLWLDDATALLAFLADCSIEPGRQIAREFAAHAPTPLGRSCRTSN